MKSRQPIILMHGAFAIIPTKPALFRSLLIAVVVALCLPVGGKSHARDWRNIRTGSRIPGESYVDQPYVVITRDGNWLCTLTTGSGVEGQPGQHIVSTISTDAGRTWSTPLDIEPAAGPEASWAMPLVTPNGRVYVFYDYNGDKVDTLPDGRKVRADMLGWYCYRYSDDNGRTWSQRLRLPVRVTACDRANDWSGRVQIMWGIGKPVICDNSAIFAFTKLGRYMLENGEGWFFRSDNVLTEPDPARIRWQMLPDGDAGLRSPDFGSIQEEHNIVSLGNAGLYCMYRTTTGWPVQSYSRDGGHTWSKPQAAAYTPDGRKFKHPRACPRLWRTADKKFLFWFHNHGGKDFNDRNPAWISGGIEKDGFIHWSQPEVLLYDPDPNVRISYPDLIEQEGRFWITETQKQIARVHRIDRVLLDDLWRQGRAGTVTTRGLILSLNAAHLARATQLDMPMLPNLAGSNAFTIDLWITLDSLAPGQTILDSRDGAAKGITLTTTDMGALRLDLCDGTRRDGWACDPGLLRPAVLHHVVFIVDGGPKIISVVVDGLLCDGGSHRQFGWGRFDDRLADVTGAGKLTVSPSLKGRLESLRIYDRHLRTSEAIANFHAGP